MIGVGGRFPVEVWVPSRPPLVDSMEERWVREALRYPSSSEGKKGT